MIRLSVNVNKIATVRNARGGAIPSVCDAVQTCLDAGAGGITVHPRADERHITRHDVREIAGLLRDRARRGVEYNIEGDPRPEWLELVHEVRPDQATLVPVRPGEITSEAGWPEDTDAAEMQSVVRALRDRSIRVSLFVEASEHAVEWAHAMGANRVELYTGPFAHAFAKGDAGACYALHVAAAERAHALGLGVNAGHDLDLGNLVRYRDLPYLDEVSIGHALVAHALFVGLDRSVRDYLGVLSGK